MGGVVLLGYGVLMALVYVYFLSSELGSWSLNGRAGWAMFGVKISSRLGRGTVR